MTDVADPTWDGLGLAEHHVKMLVDSGVTPELAKARGYRTITADQVDQLAELKPNPFGRTLRHPGLLVPSHGVTGGIVGHQLRPDHDVVNSSGEVRKYIGPYGERAVVDCPPTMLDAVRDPAVPLLITEGSKKADSAAARGIPCLALRGVDGWSSERTALEDWRDVPMKGRRVGIAYDSDILTKPGVMQAARRLGKYLARQKEALVEYVVLPARADGKKQGLDDWLVANPTGDPWDLAVDKLVDPEAVISTNKKKVMATDLEIADEWVRQYRGHARFLTDEKLWVVYHEGVWDPRGGDTLARAAFQDLARGVQAYTLAMDKQSGEMVEKDATAWLYQASRITAVLNHASANRQILLRGDQLDTDPYLFNVANGTIDLRTGRLQRHDPDDLISQRSDVPFDADAEAPKFEEFLKLILPDEETRAFVQRLLGMALIGEVTEHIFPIFQGKGRNGKGTLLRLAQAAFGTYYSGISKDLLIETKYEDHPTIRARLFRKRLVTASEVPEHSTWNAASIKELTGGDDIEGRHMRGNPFTFKPSHTLILSANHWPSVSAKDDAFWARVRKVPFPYVFDHPDSTIEKDMHETELPGILRWLVDGCVAYRREGLGEPASVAVATAGIRAESDPLHSFLADFTEVTHDPHDTVLFAALYKLYQEWHRDTRQKSDVLSRMKFGPEVAKTAGIAQPRKVGKNKETTFFGIRLLEGGETGPATDSDLWEGFEARPIDDPRSATWSANRSAWSADTAGEGGATQTTVQAPMGPKMPTEGSADQLSPVADQVADQVADLATDVSAGEAAKADQADQADQVKGHSTDISETSCKAVELKSTENTQTPSASPTSQIKGNPESAWSAWSAWSAVELDLPTSDPSPSVEFEGVDLASWSVEGDLELPAGVVVFDIESASEALWPARPDFIRITGVQEGRTIRVTADAAEVARLLRTAKTIVGHNIMSFDLVAFALHHGVDIYRLAEEGRVIDTMLTEIVTNPPEARTARGKILKDHGLDALGLAKFGVGKTDDLGKLAKEFGGFDKIPTNEKRYVSYCAGDVNLTARLAASQPRSAYAKREHKIAAIAAQMRMSGFRVDVDLVQQRIAESETRRREGVQRLSEQYGLPLVKADGKEAKAPLATEAGKEAIRRAYADLGVELGKTKSGQPAFGKEARAEIIETYSHREDVMELNDTVDALLGIRTVYATVDKYRIGDRVHPDIAMFQASGRWSTVEPGLTVMGKRGGKYVERDMFLPEPGHIIVSADLSQVDARAVAAWCQDPAYMELFEGDRDSHTEIALKVWNDAGRRDDAKVLGHGWNYGMGIAKLAKKIGSEEVAREFDRSMKEEFPGLVAWKREVAALADSGELLDNGFGRKLRTTAPRFIEAEGRWTSPGWTQGPALVGQSAARDIMMEALLRLPRDLHQYLRAVVHDEIVLSIPEDRADEIEAQIETAMTFEWAPRPGDRKVLFKGEAGQRGTTWGRCYEKKPKAAS